MIALLSGILLIVLQLPINAALADRKKVVKVNLFLILNSINFFMFVLHFLVLFSIHILKMLQYFFAYFLSVITHSTFLSVISHIMFLLVFYQLLVVVFKSQTWDFTLLFWSVHQVVRPFVCYIFELQLFCFY